MLRKFSKRNLLIFFVFTSFTWICVDCNVCETHIDCETYDEYKNYSKCVNKICHCLDYYVLGRDTCVIKVPSGEVCSEPSQCTGGPMGELSFCNKTSQMCECRSLTGSAVTLVDGKCTLVRKLEQSCFEDAQCILGSNEFARCINQTCSCLSNSLVKFGPNSDQMCVLQDCNDSSCVDISVFAATMAGSAALLVLIVVIYRVTNPNRSLHKGNLPPPEVQRKVSIQAIDLPSTSSPKHDVP